MDIYNAFSLLRFQKQPQKYKAHTSMTHFTDKT